MGTGDSSSGNPRDLKNDVPFTPEGAFQLNAGHLILFAGDQFVIWDANTNSATFSNKLSNYFGTPPSKTSFAVEDRLYFLNGDNYVQYNVDAKAVVSTKPMKSLLTC